MAKALELSTSTISKALRDSYEISQETKSKVLAYAAEVGYHPNNIAKSLKEGRSRTIGVVICSIDNNFVSQILNGIDRHCNSRGYNMIIMQSKESNDQEKKCVELLYARGIDGLLISPAIETDDVTHLIKLHQQGLPIVLFDRISDQLNVPKVTSDNEKGAFLATEHLLQNGYKKIAVLCSHSKLNINVERLAGYRQALKHHGIPFREELIKPCKLNCAALLRESLLQAMQELMSANEIPDAILATSDQISTQCLNIIHQLGYRIPQDIALIGFTNAELAEALNPSLSTINQPADEMGELAAQKLLDLIEQKDTASLPVTKLNTSLIIRNSSEAKMAKH